MKLLLLTTHKARVPFGLNSLYLLQQIMLLPKRLHKVNKHRKNTRHLLTASCPRWQAQMPHSMKNQPSLDVAAREALEAIRGNLNISTLQDWYSVSVDTLQKHGVKRLLRRYNNSPAELLQAAYPEHNWELWRFSPVPRGWWTKQENIRSYFDWLFNELQLKSMDDWYNVHLTRVIKKYGLRQLKATEALMTAYPEHHWEPWKFHRVRADNAFKDENDCLAFLKWAQKELKLESMEDWYKVTADSIIELGGAGLLRHFNDLPTALQQLFPSHKWLPWRCVSLPKGWWHNTSHQRQFVDWLKDKLEKKTMTDMYSLTKLDFIRNGGGQLLQIYNNSPSLIVTTLYPEHTWLLWRFRLSPRNFWGDKSNWKEFCDWFASTRSFQSLEDWYNVSCRDLAVAGGAALLKRTNGSLIRILTTAYPLHRWEPWKFKYVGRGFWINLMQESKVGVPENLKLFVQSLAKTLGLSLLEDPEAWKRVSLRSLTPKQRFQLKQLGGLKQVMLRIFPKYQWESQLDSRYSEQRFLLSLLMKVIPDKSLQENFTQDQITWSSGQPMEADIAVRSLNLVIEFQGLQHYFDVTTYGQLEHQLNKDATKAVVYSMKGKTLVEVPYWWPRTEQCLLTTMSVFNLHPTHLAQSTFGCKLRRKKQGSMHLVKENVDCLYLNVKDSER